MNLDPNWKRHQRYNPDKFKAVRDIIRYCTLPKHDKLFAKKYGLSLATVTRIRLGYIWKRLRRKMEKEDDEISRRPSR